MNPQFKGLNSHVKTEETTQQYHLFLSTVKKAAVTKLPILALNLNS